MSRIEQIINEMDEYLESCKYQTLSKVNIIVNKEELQDMIFELRLRVPEETKKYQKIIGQQEAILQDARTQAQNMIDDATQHTNELVSEHEIMQLAYQKANEVVQEARERAESIVNSAISDANEIRYGAMTYTDGLLASLQGTVETFVTENRAKYDEMLDSFRSVYDTCAQNRSDIASNLSLAENTPQPESDDTTEQ